VLRAKRIKSKIRKRRIRAQLSHLTKSSHIYLTMTLMKIARQRTTSAQTLLENGHFRKLGLTSNEVAGREEQVRNGSGNDLIKSKLNYSNIKLLVQVL